jgi:hypothetical protein
MSPGVMTYVQDLINIGSGIQNLIVLEFTDTRISLQLFFRNKESTIRKGKVISEEKNEEQKKEKVE